MINYLKENLMIIIKGMVVGTGAILPGVSGGVLCVAFGIYEPLMDVLSDPVNNIKKHLKLLIPFLIGWLIGFLLLAKLMSFVFERYESLAIILFAGLIIGTLPLMFKQLNHKNYLLFAITSIIFIFVFKKLDSVYALSIEANSFWYMISGIIWGLSLIVPGLSSSSLLIIMGLYQKITEAIANLNFMVIIPLLFGLLITVVSLSKYVTYLFNNHKDIIVQFVSGVMFASSICMIEINLFSVYDIVISILLFVIGYVLALKME